MGSRTRRLPESYGPADVIREVMRRVITKLCGRYSAGEQADIALVSSPRSGSTWLMESLASLPGYKSLDEPDHREMLEFHGLLQIEPRWNWICLSDAEREDFGDFLLDDRRSGLFGPVRPAELRAQWVAHRRVIKLVRCTALLDWIDDLGFETVYLVRHPIPQAMSCLARGHAIRVQEFLSATCFAPRLTAVQVEHAHAAVRHPDRIDSFVTQWCLENVVPLASERLGKDIAVSAYEHRVMDPEGEALRLAKALRVPAATAMLAGADRPSRVSDSSSAETRNDIRSRRSDKLVAGWRRRLSAEDEHRLMGIVEDFEIDTYRQGEDLPSWHASWT